MFSIEDVLELAIRLEKNGEAYYRRFANATEDHEINKVLLWLADQEMAHAEFFTRLKQLQAKPHDIPEGPDGVALQDFLGNRALSLDEVSLAQLTDLHQVLRAALEFEHDTILFFDMIRAFVTEESALAQLDAIIEEERRHIEMVQGLIVQGPSPKLRLDRIAPTMAPVAA
jgi:rubrerythrin